ncbi:MAG: argininosuccinate synthase [Candidatus Magasanikbacteria bacterium]|jgi:argininosuccinate synthase|nr:argininosuccinate synthase [Candidatus Magasanikbacteria bacterium]MBT4315172.1 argininosuccinate synthase [Candidatus Magasanikbacteria bacterium]MBT4547372.1 argininosuccinate synthase [Candidatus Magasanikbacteria bacterium]MBT6819027.1 argininosuccinate synthase [Candidatus Magasanikbacteria bacterium]
MEQDKNTYAHIASYEPKNKEEVKKVVLLYSGGLDTSVMLKWIKDFYEAEVIALCIDIGQQVDDLDAIKQKALDLGAIKSIVIDAKDEFADKYISRGIKANGHYQGDYNLSTPIGRPLLAKLAVQVAMEEKADTIAHGCTGKGNDQVRIEGTVVTLNPDLKVIAPVREWGMGRDEEIEYAKKHNIPIPHTIDKSYSSDDNMWGVTSEGGEIENPELVPPMKKILQVCTHPADAPDEEELVEIEFVKGIPTALNNEEMKLSELIIKLNKLSGRHGIGIAHHIEDRIVGLKVRGIYEQPAAHTIIKAHKELEKYVCTRHENKFKELVDQEWAYLCYGALWFEPLMKDLSGFIDTMNEKVNGKVTLRLFKGHCDTVALKTPDALFDEKLATFMKDDLFNQNASSGFIELWTLQMKMAKQSKKNVLLTIGGQENKEGLLPEIKALEKLNCVLYATEHTSEFLDKHGVKNRMVYKISNGDSEKRPNIATLLRERRFDLIINIPSAERNFTTDTDGEKIRELSIKSNVPLVTNIDVAKHTITQLQDVIENKM